MPRDAFNTDLLTLCDEIDTVAPFVGACPQAWPHLEQRGWPAPELMRQTRAAGLRGRAAFTDLGTAGYAMREAEAVGQELAIEGLLQQKDARRVLAAVHTLHPALRDHVANLRGLFDQCQPRLRGAVDQWRRVRHALQRPDQPLLHLTEIAAMRDGAVDLAERLELAFDTREDAVREHRAAARVAEQVRLELAQLLRRVDRVWDMVLLFSNDTVPKLSFVQILAQQGRRKKAAAKAEAEKTAAEDVQPSSPDDPCT